MCHIETLLLLLLSFSITHHSHCHQTPPRMWYFTNGDQVLMLRKYHEINKKLQLEVNKNLKEILKNPVFLFKSALCSPQARNTTLEHLGLEILHKLSLCTFSHLGCNWILGLNNIPPQKKKIKKLKKHIRNILGIILYCGQNKGYQYQS